MGRAILIMFCAMTLVPMGDSVGKVLTAHYAVAPAFVAFARYLVGAAFVVTTAPRGTWALLRRPLVWLRGLSLALAIVCILTALSTAPLGNVFAAFFVGPLLSYAASALWLKERVTVARTALILLGFAGVLMVVRPGLGGAPGLGWAVLAGTLYGVYLTLNRALSAIAPPHGLLASQMIVGLAVLTPLAIGHIPAMTVPLALLFLASGLASAAGNMLLLIAYRLGSGTALAPLVYFQLIAAVGLGWAVFGDLPYTISWAGMAVIVGAGLLSARLARGSFTPLRADRA